jgi:hypothetical protein
MLEGFGLLDLLGWLERRPAPRLAGARLGRSGRHPSRSQRHAELGYQWICPRLAGLAGLFRLLSFRR